MVKAGKWIAKHRVLILIVSALLMIPSFFGIVNTRVNYDLLSYLPEHLETVKGQDILVDEYGMGAFSMVVVEDMELKDVQKLEEKFSEVPHVKDVLWYDDAADISLPVEMLPKDIREAFFKGEATMMLALFDNTTSSDEAMDAVTQMRQIADKQCFISGMTGVVTDIKNLCLHELPIYVVIAVLCCLLILELTSTLIVGGGFHGKSTLLQALERGVYNHIAGDGREYVITDASAGKLRSEDSRSIRNVDISLFIHDLPGKSDTTSFSTADASGSTSQAANVIEGIESGTSLFLIDEDTSATNFMVRDELMQRVVADSEEPITPFISRVRDLYEKLGISSILVAGSSGSYFHVADTVIQMKEYVPYDITDRAKTTAAEFPPFTASVRPFSVPAFHRCPQPGKGLTGSDRTKVKVMGRESILINKSLTDLRAVEQLTDSEQLNGLAALLLEAAEHKMDGKKTLVQVVDLLEKQMDEKGLASLLAPGRPGDLARPRRQEIFACLNRCRELRF